MNASRPALIGTLVLALTGCAALTREPTSEGAGPRARATPAPRVTPAPPGTSAPARMRPQAGTASWYGEAHHGKRTASGETYDMTKLTAAHRTLPLGTRVRVTNLANGRSVIVRINDRGPFVGGRVIDLSRAAAGALGPLGAGLFTVRLEVLEETAAE